MEKELFYFTCHTKCIIHHFCRGELKKKAAKCPNCHVGACKNITIHLEIFQKGKIVKKQFDMSFCVKQTASCLGISKCTVLRLTENTKKGEPIYSINKRVQELIVLDNTILLVYSINIQMH